MPEHMLFHFVFLCQVLLVSFYLPRVILRRMKYVLETYPPSTHPKLYPRPVEYYEGARRKYRITNLLILLAGFLLLAVLLVYPRSGKWDHVIALWYFFVQFLPVMLLDVSSLREFRLMRSVSSRTTRRAELRPRRLFDFVSPTMIGVAIITYLAFVVLVVYIRQFDFPWFGGYVNIVVVTMANLGFAGVIFRSIYGKKLNPHQAHEDRMRYIGTMVQILVFLSIAGTMLIALTIVLAALDLRSVQPIAQSVYFQLLAVISFRAYRIDFNDFEVYREDPAVT